MGALDQNIKNGKQTPDAEKSKVKTKKQKAPN